MCEGQMKHSSFLTCIDCGGFCSLIMVLLQMKTPFITQETGGVK